MAFITLSGLPILSTISLYFFGLSEFAAGAGFLSLFSIAATFTIYWMPHLKALAMSWSKDMNRLIDKLNGKLNDLLDPTGIYEDGISQEQKVVSLAKKEGLEEIQKELDPMNAPRVDAIVIISENAQDVDGLQKHMESLRGKLIRNDVPVEVMGQRFQGSANAYLDALLRIKEKFDTGVYKKPWGDSRTMFIFRGNEALADNNLIDWSITNGYRAAASMSQNNEMSGNIIIYARDPYFGPVQQVAGSNITLLTSRVKRDDLKGVGWVNTSFSVNGNTSIVEILEKLNISSLQIKDKSKPRGAKTVHHMEDEKRYDLSNEALKQFSAFNGMILMGAEAVDMYVRVAQDLENSGLRNKLRQLH